MRFEEEAVLISRARQGDPEAFDLLVARHRPLLARRLATFCLNPQDREDTIQDALIRAFSALSGFRGEASFATWTFRIARNICLRKGECARRFVVVSLENMLETWQQEPEAPAWDTDPVRACLARESLSVMHGAIATLPASYSDVFRLCALEGMPAAEAARELGLTACAVKARLHRARELLRASVSPHLAVW